MKDWSMKDLQAQVGANPDAEFDMSVSVGGEDGVDMADWSGPEIRFARAVLEPRLEDGTLIFWTYEPEIRMRGQTYTPDFHALTVDGVNLLYEIKGSTKLGSQSRSSVKIRWTASLFDCDAVQFWWCQEKEDGEWKMRQVKPRRRRHPQLKGK